MRSFPSCWNKTLAQLGFKRKLRKKAKCNDRLHRRSLFESLEQRQMLSVDGPGLTAYYTFDEDALDVTSTSYNGTAQGTPVFHTDPIVLGGAIELDGVDDYVDISDAGDELNQVDGEWSISGWMKADGIANRSQAVIGIHSSAGSNKWVMNLGRWDNSTDKVDKLNIYDVTAGNWQTASPDVAGDGRWHNFVVTRSNINGNDSTITLYLDGVQQVQYTTSLSFDVGDQWSVGQEYDGASTSDHLDGSIDELRLYDRALNSTEVEQLSRLQAIDSTDLAAHFTFDQDATDSTSNGHDATAQGTPVFHTDPIVLGGAIELDGVNDYVDISAAGDELNQVNGDWSISGWMKAHADPSQPQAVIGIHTSTGDNKWIMNLGRWGSTSATEDKLNIYDVSAGYWQTASPDVAGDGEWHNFVVTRSNINGNDSTITLYLDGVQQVQYTTSLSFDVGDQWSVGQEYDGATPSDFLGGSVDELRLYDRELTSTEIGQLAGASFVAGQPLMVSTTADENDGNYGVGDLSLREALYLADIIPAHNSIEFDLDFTNPKTITLNGSELLIDSDVSIAGPGQELLTISANTNSRVFNVQADNDVTISGITIANGHIDGSGGGAGIYNRGNLTLEESTLLNNTAVEVSQGNGGWGGAIYNQTGALTISNSTFEGNTGRWGGAVWINQHDAAAQDVQILGSTFLNNEAENLNSGGLTYAVGGGVFVQGDQAQTLIANSTFSGNSALHGGAIRGNEKANIKIVNSTLSENHVEGSGGGISVSHGSTGSGSIVTIQNSILAGNTAGSVPEDTSFHGGVLQQAESTHNIIGVDSSGQFDASENIIGQDPLLAALGDYGGSTLTYALMVGSPAIDAGNDSVATLNGIINSQNGIPQSMDTPGVGALGVTTEIGATSTPSIPLIVNDTSDLDDNKFGQNGDGGTLSLREAIRLANGDTMGDSITFDTGVFSSDQTITLTDQGENAFANALHIKSDLEILGPGRDILSISGGEHLTKVLYVASDVSVTLSDMTIRDGDYGGIDNSGDLDLESVVVRDNAGTGISNSGILAIDNSLVTNNLGGGISNLASLTIDNSTISNNTATWGGGINIKKDWEPDQYPVNTLIENSTISGNHAQSSGGGIRIVDEIGQGLSFIAKNVTISGNTAGWGGAGVSISASYGFDVGKYDRFELANVTITGNTVDATNTPAHIPINANGFSVGPYADPVNVHLISNNTIIAGNKTVVAGSVVTSDEIETSVAFENSFNNLFGNAVLGVAHQNNDNIVLPEGVPLGLAPLGDYGGSTQTHALLPHSPAVDAGFYISGVTPRTDQRNFSRPVDFDGNGSFQDDADIGAYELQSPILEGGDFNGDQRQDQVFLDEVFFNLNVLADLGDRFELSSWDLLGDLEDGGIWQYFRIGDFDGDGRDDILAQNTQSGDWIVSISDGTQFNTVSIVDSSNSPIVFSAISYKPYSPTYAVGDFDGDGSDELLGLGDSNWKVLDFDERLGSSLSDWGSAFDGISNINSIQIADANRDGHDDLISHDGNDWYVGLSQDDNQFVVQNWGDWFDEYNSGGVVDVDGPYRKLTEIFAGVYNNVELELYAGIKKGPDATENTQSGNPWDQAALLVQRLEDVTDNTQDPENDLLPTVLDPKIVGGRVTVPRSIAKDWLGAKSESAVSDLLATMDLLAIDGVVDPDTQDGVPVITFDHAWVRATVPTASGLAEVDLDPSWKFKDYQEGIQLPTDFVNGIDTLEEGLFGEFSYLESSVRPVLPVATPDFYPIINPDSPLEYFEGKLQQYLVENETGKSLADVRYDGPLKNLIFDTLPTGPWTNDNTSDVSNYGTIHDIGTESALTYRFRFSAFSTDPSAAFTPTTPFPQIPQDWDGQFDTYELTETNPILASDPTYGDFVTGPYTFHADGSTKWTVTTSLTAGPSSNTLDFELLADGTLIKSGSRTTTTSTPHPRVYVEIYSPGEVMPSFVADVETAASNSFANVLLEPDSTYSFAFDAGQYTRNDVETLTDQLRGDVANNNSPDMAYDELVSIATTEYLFEKNQSLQLVADLTATDYQLDYGLAVAHSTNTTQPDVDLSLSPFGIFPTKFSISDLRTKAVFVGIENTAQTQSEEVKVEEASQLGSWQASSVQSEVHEKLTGSDGISTLRYVQRAYAGQRGWKTNGYLNQRSSPSYLHVLETRIDDEGYPSLWYRGDSKASFSLASTIVPYPFDSVHPMWRSSTLKLSEINDTNIQDVKNEVGDAIGVFLRGRGAINTTVKDELAQYLKSLLTLNDTNTGHFEETKIIVPEDNIAIGKSIGAGFFGGNLDSEFGTHTIDQFGDDEISGDEPSVGPSFYTGIPVSEIPNELEGIEQFNVDYRNLPNRFSSSVSGHTVTEATDIVFPNIGVPLDFTRSYSSNYELSLNEDEDHVLREVGLGLGWTHSFSDRIIIGNDDSIPELIWLRSTGQQHRFVFDGVGKYIVPSELLGKFQGISGGGYEYLERDGTRYEFKLTGEPSTTPGNIFARLSKITDRNQNGFEVTYVPDTVDRIDQVRDVHLANNRRLEFTYEEQNNTGSGIWRISGVTKVVDDSEIGTWTYQYDPIDDPSDNTITNWYLETGTSPNDTDYADAANLVTTYEYYDIDDPEPYSGLLKRITAPNTDYREFDYYLNRRKLRETYSANEGNEEDATVSRTYSYNLVTNTTEITDERGNVTTNLYQRNGLQLRQINADRTRQEFTWGDIGTSEEYLIQTSTDEVGATETYDYYTSGFQDRQLSESISKRFLMLDAMGDLVLVPFTQPGITTKYTYRQGTAQDDEGNPIHEHIVDTLTITVDPDGTPFVTRYEYYPDTDLQHTIENSLGETTTFTYYSDSTYLDGLTSTQKRPKNFTTHYNYDEAGNLTDSTTDTIKLSTTQYDHYGQPKVVTETGTTSNPAGVVYESEYDVLGRLRSTSLGDGDEPLDDFTNYFGYDENGQITSSTDRNGNTTTSLYDLRGNVVTKTNPDGTIVQFEYDQASNLVAQTDELGRTTRFVYDSRNRRIQTIFPDGFSSRTIYDGVGRVSATIDARGNKTSFEYDVAGRLLKTINANPDTSENTSENKYDELGRLIWTRDFNGNYTLFKHDDLGRVIETLILDKQDTPSSITRNPEFASTTEYDANGNVFRTAVYDVNLLIADGLTTLTGFLNDPQSLLTPANLQTSTPYLQVTKTIYDSLDRPTETIFVGAKVNEPTNDVAVRTEYDEAGRVEFTFDELNRETKFFYDAYGRLERTELPDPDGEQNPAQSSPKIYQAYDDAGNLVSTTDANGHITTNSYDVFNRLVSTTDAEGNTTRTVYDVAGQMVATIDALGRALYMSYDSRGRVKFDRSPDPDGSGPLTALTTEYEYDAVSNRIGMTNANGYSTTYRYDELNRLVEEFTTDVQIYDIVDPDNDPVFAIVDGTQSTATDVDTSFGRDHTDITGSGGLAPEVTWTLDNLQLDDNYSVALTWSVDTVTALDDSATATIEVFDAQGASQTLISNIPIDQSNDPNDLALDYQGHWRGWRKLADKLSVVEGGKIVVTLTGSSVAATIRADAVMLDREVSRKYDYDGNGNLVTETDVLGRQTTNIYDARNLLTSTTLPDPDASANNSGGPGGSDLISPVIEQVYDGYGNVIETIEQRGSAAVRTQKFEYDKRNRLIKSISNYQDGSYDNTFTDQDIITENVYDDVGNLKQVNTAVGSPEETANSFDYDDLNRLKTEHIDVNGYNHRNEHEYDDAGNLKRTESFTNDPSDSDEASTVTTYEYDKINRLIKQTDDFGGNPYNVNVISRFIYDGVSNVLQEIDPTGRVTTYEYDRLNRVVKTISPDPDAPGSGQEAPSMKYDYDTLGNVAIATNSEGEITQSIYDTLGREISKFDANFDETRYRYDAYGNLRSVIDAEESVTNFEYDDLDRVKKDTIYENRDLGQPLTRTYIYDDALNLKRYIDRNDRGVQYTYDGLDRLSKEEWFVADSNLPAGTLITETHIFSGTNEGELEWDYDALGRVTRALSDMPGTNRDYEETWEYDNLGRVTLHRNYDPDGGNYNPRVEQTYTYDQISNPNSATPFESTYTQSLGESSLAQTTYYSDRLGRVITIQDDDQTGTIHDVDLKTISYTYDAAGRMLTAGRASGSFAFDTKYQYDGTGRLQNLLHRRNGESNPFMSYGYIYDTASRITDLDRYLDTSIAAFSTLTTNRTEEFAFDDAGQLTERNDTNTTTTDDYFTYDENGNRKTANGVSYTTDANNRVTNDGTYTYVYDNEGNLKERSDGVSTFVYTWDHRNRLIKVTENQDGSSVTDLDYRYNSDDLLVSKDNNLANATEHYILDGTDRVMQLDGNGTLEHRQIRGPQIDDLVFEEVFNQLGQQEDLYAPVTDHLSTTRAVLDENADVIQTIDYNAFGEIIDIRDDQGQREEFVPPTGPAVLLTSQLVTTVAFAGREWDDDADLYYNRARWFDANLGRFISVDPLGFDAGDSNLYRYGGNDPLNRFDPSGQSWLSSIFDTIGDITDDIIDALVPFDKVREELSRVNRQLTNFAVDTFEYIGDHIGNTIDTFEFIVKNPEDAFKAMVKDPLFWGQLALGQIFTAGFSWGFFDVGIGLNGLNATPNLLNLGKQALNFATGGNFNFGGPTLNISSRLLDFSRSIDVGAFLSGPTSGSSSPYWVTDQEIIIRGQSPSGSGGFGAVADPFSRDLGNIRPYPYCMDCTGGYGQYVPYPEDPWTTQLSNAAESFGDVMATAVEDFLPYAKGTAETVGGILYEPYDWFLTAKEIYSDPTSPYSYAGLLPFVPASVGKRLKSTVPQIGEVIIGGIGGEKIKGVWYSTEGWVANKANNILKKHKLSGAGAGARSGQHGVPFNRAASELNELAKDPDLLDDVREELRRKADEFRQKAREINHPMR